ncbi:MAG: hypothetical protein JWQ35_1812 [Bacteriovoracaceae bacterium]|nr:hypothetical protein [Bacteriovoracaceae bacterium]
MVVIIGGGKRIGKGLVKAYSKKHQVLFTYHSSEGFKGKNIRAARLDVRNILEIKAFAKSFKPKSVKALIYVASSFKRVNFGATLES